MFSVGDSPKIKMKTVYRFSTCMCIILLINCCRFSFGNEMVGDPPSDVSSSGESPLETEAEYRQRRSDQYATNEVDGGKDGDDNEDAYSGQSDPNEDDDGNDEYGDDGEDDESESEEGSESTSPNINESLNLLKNTRKSVGRYVSEDSSLNQLVSESSQLAKEVAEVFHQLAKREVGLEKEMESLKDALNGAVASLKNTIKVKELSENQTDGDGGSSGEVGDEEKRQTLLRQRRHFYPKNPYRACVQIEPMSDDELYGTGPVPGRKVGSGAGHLLGQPSNPVPVAAVPQEFMPSRKDLQISKQIVSLSSALQAKGNPGVHIGYGNNAPPPPNYPPPGLKQSFSTGSKTASISVNNQQSLPRPVPPAIPRPLPMLPQPPKQPLQPQAQPPRPTRANIVNNMNPTQTNINQAARSMDAVDLSEVYWLRLNPKQKQEILHNKLDSLLKQKQSQGQDVLVIPLTHGLRDAEEVKNGFLRAVRVRPDALKIKKRFFRELRSLQVLEL